jgi:hypothetical protein
MDKAYAPPPEPNESKKEYRCWVYKIMHILFRTTPAAPAMRTVSKWPNANWGMIWQNIHDAPVNET